MLPMEFTEEHMNLLLARVIVQRLNDVPLQLYMSLNPEIFERIVIAEFFEHREHYPHGTGLQIFDVAHGINIQDMIDLGYTPKIHNGVLNLSDLGIAFIDGIENIPGIEDVTHIDLSVNKLNDIELDNLTAPKLEWISFEANSINRITRNSFEKYPNLREIDIAENPITTACSRAFDGLPRDCKLSYTKFRKYNDEIFSQDITVVNTDDAFPYYFRDDIQGNRKVLSDPENIDQEW